MNVESRPEPTVIPYILVQGAAQAIDFYRSVFGATETGARFTDPAGKVGHAEIMIGNSKIMLADEQPPEYRFAPIMFHLRVENVECGRRRRAGHGRRRNALPRRRRSGVRRSLRRPTGPLWTQLDGEPAGRRGFRCRAATARRRVVRDHIIATCCTRSTSVRAVDKT
jgi:PhnB protein